MQFLVVGDLQDHRRAFLYVQSERDIAPQHPHVRTCLHLIFVVDDDDCGAHVLRILYAHRRPRLLRWRGPGQIQRPARASPCPVATTLGKAE